MKRYILFSLLILTFAFTVNAQKLIYGGKPKLFESKGNIKAYEVKFPNGLIVRKFDRKTEDDANGFFEISKGRNALGEISASINGASSTDNFHAFFGDLDKNKSAELVIVDFDVQSNGLGVSYYTINIFPDFETKGFQTPITFNTQEFGANGTFVYDAKTKETLILLTEWGGVQITDPKRGEGLYFTGRFFRYSDGKLKLATDKPILARRYLYSFERERFRTKKDSRRPYLWLTSPDSIKLTTDPVFALKPISTQTGIIEKYEDVTEKRVSEDSETKDIFISQIVVKLDSGESKICVLSKSEEYTQLPSDKDKIFPEDFGILPVKLTFPGDFNPKLAFDELEGKRVQINAYQADSESPLTYKLWFVEK